jgi:hypothetical protein
MWPFTTISALRSEVARLEDQIRERAEEVSGARRDEQELEFLRNAIKPYVVYGRQLSGSAWPPYYKFVEGRTLHAAESDLTKARLYISVLESQLGKERTDSSRKICQELTCLCKKEMKAIE